MSPLSYVGIIVESDLFLPLLPEQSNYIRNSSDTKSLSFTTWEYEGISSEGINSSDASI